MCRELAHQIAEQFRVLGKPIGLRDLVITGGRGVFLVTSRVVGFDFGRNFVVTLFCCMS